MSVKAEPCSVAPCSSAPPMIAADCRRSGGRWRGRRSGTQRSGTPRPCWCCGWRWTTRTRPSPPPRQRRWPCWWRRAGCMALRTGPQTRAPWAVRCTPWPPRACARTARLLRSSAVIRRNVCPQNFCDVCQHAALCSVVRLSAHRWLHALSVPESCVGSRHARATAAAAGAPARERRVGGKLDCAGGAWRGRPSSRRCRAARGRRGRARGTRGSRGPAVRPAANAGAPPAWLPGSVGCPSVGSASTETRILADAPWASLHLSTKPTTRTILPCIGIHGPCEHSGPTLAHPAHAPALPLLAAVEGFGWTCKHGA